MPTAVWQFAEVEAVYQRLRPLTPYGRRETERREILTDPAELGRRYDQLDAMTDLLADAESADRIRYHLGRIPLLPPVAQVATGADLFRVKKFLVNCKALAELIGRQGGAGQFGLAWQSDELLKALDTSDSGQETFFLADRCSEELAAVRTEIRQIDSSLRAVRAAALDALKTRHGLDFSQRDFLVIDNGRAGRLAADEVYLEPFDSGHVIVRPVLPRKHFEMLTAREALLDRERRAEQGILAELASAVREREEVLLGYVKAIQALDLALAGAELARSLGMTRPELRGPGEAIEIVGGRLVPLEEECGRQQIEYRPLTAGFDTPHVLLHGSNMTGKSVVLKTVCSLQILAQLGLFVPARQYRTMVFDQVSFIGTTGTEEARGLSSFGQEIVDLRNVLGHRDGVSLLVMDEFARTTNSQEAAALIAGLLSFLNSTDRIYSLLATHYAGLPRFDRVRPWQMKGIDWARLRGEVGSQPAGDLAARVRAINRCVPYEIVPAGDEQVVHDAVSIAAMLGLDEAIVEFARRQVLADSSEAG